MAAANPNQVIKANNKTKIVRATQFTSGTMSLPVWRSSRFVAYSSVAKYTIAVSTAPMIIQRS